MNYWERLFKDNGTLWKFEPSDSAIQTAIYFHSKGIKNALIPGIGYGRNVSPFIKKGIEVSGIEIANSAIELAREKGFNFPIFQGSVLDMPFNNMKYDGIFCYSLLHLFNKKERQEFLNSCYNQLSDDGIMVFVVISTKSQMFGKGKLIGKNRFKVDNGLNVFFYDKILIKKEFKQYGLIEYREIDEPIKFMENQPDMNCFIIKCQKTYK